MYQNSWRAAQILTLAITSFSAAAPLCAEESGPVEVRTYEVLVENNPAGESQMTYEVIDSETTKVSVQAQVKVVVLLYTYQYSLQSVEFWRQGRLAAYEGVAVDNGVKSMVKAVFGPNRSTLLVNGRSRSLQQPCLWATTYCCRPAVTSDGGLPLLDIDAGESRPGRLEALESKTVRVGTELRRCGHFRATGATKTDIWFDDRGRLVQQNFVDDGYATEVRLKSVAVKSPQQPPEVTAKVNKLPRY